MSRRNRMTTMSLALVGVAYLAGCAEVPGDIDRTQPNKIAKKMFEGEWYFRQTVVDANSTAYTMFQGLEGNMEKLKFEFTEDSLIGRRTHEDVIGISTSQQGVQGFTPEYGQPIVSFRVSQYFDVQRDYSAATGERTNTSPIFFYSPLPHVLHQNICDNWQVSRLSAWWYAHFSYNHCSKHSWEYPHQSWQVCHLLF